jgi:hypothetical protein
LPGNSLDDTPERTTALALTSEVLAMAHPFSTPRYFLRGEKGQVESVLRMVCTFLPPVLRQICSFDTQIDGCFRRDTNYLFVAGYRPPTAVQLTIVDLAASSATVIADEVCTVYLAWLGRALSSYSEYFVTRTATAYEVALGLCGRSTATKPELLDRDTCREILQHEFERLRSRMAALRRRRFRRQTSGVDFESTLSEQAQTVPEDLVAELAKNGGHGMWRVRSFFRNLWHLSRSDK